MRTSYSWLSQRFEWGQEVIVDYSLPMLVSFVILLLGSLVYFYKRSLRYLQYFQQEEYEGGRYYKWYLANRAWDKRASLLLVVPFLISIFVDSASPYLVSSLVLAAFVYVAFSEEDPLKAGKLTLKVTDRVKRIRGLALVYYLILILISLWMIQALAPKYYLPEVIFLQFVFAQSLPFLLILSNFSLDPYEKSLQEGFANQARAVIKEMKPTIIGITGSYGKTSTKILLKDILGSTYPTFSTPGSVNTYMGVTRKIREEMKPEHKFAVIEMGAYYQGSIKRMCSLTPPDCAIITTVGLAHLERFGSQENIYKAKSELAQAVPEDGILVVNGDNQYTRRMASEFPKQTTIIYGMDESKGPLDSKMTDIVYNEEGTTFKIHFRGEVYDGFTKLLGKPSLENVLGTFTLAVAVGVPADMALAVIRNARAESNRLDLQRGEIGILANTNGNVPRQGEIIRLNDAYNSNPVGFDAALEVLSEMPGVRKVLVTPGMIELGEEQYKENKAAALKASSICDLVLVVGATNSAAIIDGLKEGGIALDKYKEFDEMKQALLYLATEYCQSGDIVLIENDLPDLYEGVVKF